MEGSRYLFLAIKLFDLLPWADDVKNLGLVCSCFARARRQYYLPSHVRWNLFDESLIYLDNIRLFPHHVMYRKRTSCVLDCDILSQVETCIDYKGVCNDYDEFPCLKQLVGYARDEYDSVIVPYGIKSVTIYGPLERVAVPNLANVEELTVLKNGGIKSITYAFSSNIYHLKYVHLYVGGLLKETLAALPNCVEKAYCSTQVRYFKAPELYSIAKYPASIKELVISFGQDNNAREAHLRLQSCNTLEKLAICSEENTLEYSPPLGLNLYVNSFPALTHLQFEGDHLRVLDGYSKILPKLQHISLLCFSIDSLDGNDTGRGFFINLSPELEFLSIRAHHSMVVFGNDEMKRPVPISYSKSVFSAAPKLSVVMLNAWVDFYFDDNTDLSRFDIFELHEPFNIHGRIQNIHCRQRVDLSGREYLDEDYILDIVDTPSENPCPNIILGQLFLKTEPKSFQFRTSQPNTYLDQQHKKRKK